MSEPPSDPGCQASQSIRVVGYTTSFVTGLSTRPARVRMLSTMGMVFKMKG